MTVHFPWVPRPAVDAATLAGVRTLAASVAPFPVSFAELRWFGEAVAYLAPEPERPFRELAERSAAQWPDHPLYNGEFTDAVPHLTLGDLSRGGDGAALREAAGAIEVGLPLRSRAEALTWLTLGAGGHWAATARIALGTGELVNLS